MLDPKTFEYRKIGLFESNVAAQRLFLSQIARDMKTHGLPVIHANSELVAELPDAGREWIDEQIERLSIRTEGEDQ